ncbi:electron transfer flavoprotein beta subunit lysine methyltransferase-like [Ptychodera flava]|uniref:electron transfer flavoprotein beta subunit lysine methyltransferase-like n=1 Tax=Ptychodera flava TaxID=63121 RepID=UPI003969F77E
MKCERNYCVYLQRSQFTLILYSTSSTHMFNLAMLTLCFRRVLPSSTRLCCGRNSHLSSIAFNFNKYFSNSNIEDIDEFIHQNTKISINHLTPEIKLRLITPECKLWTSPHEDCHVSDPFWAFYWPGGQVLTRFLLDNPDYVHGKTVLDVGSGCGASAIAAAMLGAKYVLANDIDPVAVRSIQVNANLNDVTIATTTQNLIGQFSQQWDTVLLGDMFYDVDFTTKVTDWLLRLLSLKKASLFLIGDPGRIFLNQHPIRGHLSQVGKYSLPQQCREENHGFTDGTVWSLANEQT